MNEDKFEKAVKLAFDEEFDKIFENIQCHEFSEKFDKDMSKLIKNQKKPYFKLISTAGRRVACFIAVMLIGFASILSVDAVREPIHDFVISVFSDRTEVDISNSEGDGAIIDIYELTSIPDDFEMTLDCVSIDFSIKKYSNGIDDIYFGQYVKSTYYDVEFGNVELYTDDTGQEYLIDESITDFITIVWDAGDYVLHINTTLDRETALEMCRSAKKSE